MPAKAGIFPPFVGVILFLVVIVGSVYLYILWRDKSARIIWDRMAKELSGKCEVDAKTKKLKVKGQFEGFNAFLVQDVGHEDAIPYPHTRGSLNLRNPAMVIMGMRHKSMLEEVQTRKEASEIDTGDTEFDKLFFVVSNVPEILPPLLGDTVRKSLRKYHDVEVYLRASRIEWRRAGLMRSTNEMMELYKVIFEIGRLVEALPPRTVTLTQKMADEALIEKGV